MEKKAKCPLCQKVCKICQKAKCSICQRVLFKKYITSHEENQSKPKPEKITEFKCEHCHKTYSTKFAKQNHIDIVHMKLRKHKCNLYGKAFTDKNKIRIQMPRM